MVRERVNRVLQLRLESKTIKEISEKLNLSDTTISDDLKVAYEESSDLIKEKLDVIAYEIKSKYKDKKLNQTLKLRLQGRSINEISEILKCSASTVRWRLREIEKEEGKPIITKLDKISKKLKHKKKDRITFYDLTDYELGIFWGMGSYNQENNTATFRETRKYFIEVMKNITNNDFYTQDGSKGKTQYVLKSCLFDMDSFIENGWTERNSQIRDMPYLEGYKDFMRGYIEMHSGLSYNIRYGRNKRKKQKRLMFRIYGNYKLIDSINNILHEDVGVGKKTPQKTMNETTKILNYTSLKEIEEISNWLIGAADQYCNEYWDELHYKLRNPIIEVS